MFCRICRSQMRRELPQKMTAPTHSKKHLQHTHTLARINNNPVRGSTGCQGRRFTSFQLEFQGLHPSLSIFIYLFL